MVNVSSLSKVSVAILLLSTLLATNVCLSQTDDGLTGTERANRATVTGSPEHLGKFVDKLRQLAGTPNLENLWIGCDKCGQLGSTPPPATLKLIFLRTPQDRLGMVLDAWDHVDRDSGGDVTLNIKIDSVIIAHVCATITPTCKNAAYCEYLTGGCDKVPSPAGCQLCQ